MMSLLSGGLTRDFARLLPRAVRSAGKPRASRRHFLRDAPLQAPPASMRLATRGAVTVPYVDINPNRSRPKWWAYVGLSILALATGFVVFLALAGR
jgi:hypothetical protein